MLPFFHTHAQLPPPGGTSSAFLQTSRPSSSVSQLQLAPPGVGGGVGPGGISVATQVLPLPLSEQLQLLLPSGVFTGREQSAPSPALTQVQAFFPGGTPPV